MARFRCPSASTASIDSTQLRRVDILGRVSKVAKMTLRREPNTSDSSSAHSSTKSSKRDQKKAMIKEALRLDQLRLNMKKRESSFIYVGNLPPTTTEATLRQHFKSCGIIDSITIRCSAGAALAGKAHAFTTPHDRQYATILFARSRSVTKALQLNGTRVQGYQLAVCLSPGELPDLEEIIGFRIRSIQERKGAPRRPQTGFRGLMPAPTERVIHGANTQQIVAPPVQPAQAQAQPQSLLRGFMFWNMTFAKTVI
ncbi:hypothetical protein FIBSPDRAFT_1036496 [Athelia psychrophila]|uniref:RRM domain-containing protein n=1 Tax=Athelia psychrophila TaxID=1759441 RepID=A0A166VLY0_9AGAM|nr:hypothetical protein FIBSPDRAFT_1036496 [Fibularhizoctonia sp. CBS 109695]